MLRLWLASLFFLLTMIIGFYCGMITLGTAEYISVKNPAHISSWFSSLFFILIVNLAVWVWIRIKAISKPIRTLSLLGIASILAEIFFVLYSLALHLN